MIQHVILHNFNFSFLSLICSPPISLPLFQTCSFIFCLSYSLLPSLSLFSEPAEGSEDFVELGFVPIIFFKDDRTDDRRLFGKDITIIDDDK